MTDRFERVFLAMQNSKRFEEAAKKLYGEPSAPSRATMMESTPEQDISQLETPKKPSQPDKLVGKVEKEPGLQWNQIQPMPSYILSDTQSPSDPKDVIPGPSMQFLKQMAGLTTEDGGPVISGTDGPAPFMGYDVAAPDRSAFGELQAGIGRGVGNIGIGMKSLAVMGGDVLGQKEFADRQQREVEKLQKFFSNREFTPGMPSVTDIRSPGDAVKWLAGGAGEQIPILMSMGLGQGVAGIAGSAATVGGMEVGSIYQDLASKGHRGGKGAAIAVGHGTLAAALDVLPMTRVFNKMGLGNRAKKEILQNLEKRGAAKLLGDVAIQGGLEGSTESLQTVLELAAMEWVDKNNKLFSPENLNEILNAGVLGTVLGTAMGGGSTAIEEVNNRRLILGMEFDQNLKAVLDGENVPVEQSNQQAVQQSQQQISDASRQFTANIPPARAVPSAPLEPINTGRQFGPEPQIKQPQTTDVPGVQTELEKVQTTDSANAPVIKDSLTTAPTAQPDGKADGETAGDLIADTGNKVDIVSENMEYVELVDDVLRKKYRWIEKIRETPEYNKAFEWLFDNSPSFYKRELELKEGEVDDPLSKAQISLDRAVIKRANMTGNPVPAELLAEYPDLIADTGNKVEKLLAEAEQPFDKQISLWAHMLKAGEITTSELGQLYSRYNKIDKERSKGNTVADVKQQGGIYEKIAAQYEEDNDVLGLISELEGMEDLPESVQAAINDYHVAHREHYDQWGGRMDTEGEAAEKLYAAVRQADQPTGKGYSLPRAEPDPEGRRPFEYDQWDHLTPAEIDGETKYILGPAAEINDDGPGYMFFMWPEKGYKTISAEKEAKDKGEVLTPDQAKSRIDQWKATAKKSSGNGNKLILSLFDRTGEWSKPYRDAGYDVLQVDVTNDWDLNIFDITPEWLIDNGYEDVAGILAAPPCTDFASSGARWWAEKDKDGRTDRSRAIIEHTLQVIEWLKPHFWVLENPVGRITKETGIPNPLLQFHPHNYGSPYTKRTQLWGNFNTNLPQANVEPTEGSMVYKLRGDDPEQKAARSVTPEGFSYAFFMANHHEGNSVVMPAPAVVSDPPSATPVADDKTENNSHKTAAQPAALANVPPERMAKAAKLAQGRGQAVYISQTPAGKWTVTKTPPKGRTFETVEPVTKEEKIDKVSVNDIETPLVGHLNSVVEAKKKAFTKVKSLRSQIKDEPLRGNLTGLRVELIEAEDKHKNLIAAEKETRKQIEARANELGKTTANQPAPEPAIQESQDVAVEEEPKKKIIPKRRYSNIPRSWFDMGTKLFHAKGKIKVAKGNGLPMSDTNNRIVRVFPSESGQFGSVPIRLENPKIMKRARELSDEIAKVKMNKKEGSDYYIMPQEVINILDKEFGEGWRSQKPAPKRSPKQAFNDNILRMEAADRRAELRNQMSDAEKGKLVIEVAGWHGIPLDEVSDKAKKYIEAYNNEQENRIESVSNNEAEAENQTQEITAEAAAELEEIKRIESLSDEEFTKEFGELPDFMDGIGEEAPEGTSFTPDPTEPVEAKGPGGFISFGSSGRGKPTVNKPWLTMEKSVSPDKDIEDFFGRTKKMPSRLKASKIIEKIKLGFRERFLTQTPHLSNDTKWALAKDVIRTMPEKRRTAGVKAVEDMIKLLDNEGKGVQGLDAAGLDLLRRKVFVQDLLYEAKIDRSIAGDLKLESLQAENKRLDELINQVPSVKSAYEARQKMWKEISKDLYDRGVLDEDARDNTAYVRHFVLDYIENNKRPVSGKRKNLSEPYRTYKKQRTGSRRDISTDYLAVEVNALKEIYEDNAVEDEANEIGEKYNREKEFKALAKSKNFENLVGGKKIVNRINELRGLIAESRESGDNDSQERLQRKQWIEELTELDPTYPYRQKIAMFLAKFKKATGLDVDAIEEWYGDDSVDIFKELQKEIDKNPNSEGALAARGVFKAIADRNKLIKETLGKDFLTTDKLAKQKGYIEWHYKRPNLFYRAKTLPEARVAAILENSAEDAGGMLNIPKSIMRDALVLGKRTGWYIPEELAMQLDDLPVNRRSNMVVESFTKPMWQWWKRWILRVNPLRYNSRNAIGDSERLHASGQTKALKYLPDAVKILTKKDSQDFKDAESLGVISSSLWHEMGDVSRIKEFDKFKDITTQKDFKRVVKNVFEFPLRKISAVGQIEQDITQFREDLLRMSLYLKAIDDINAGRKLRHWAGNVADINELVKESKERAAAKLSRETLIDYGSFTPFENDILRNGLMPFYSFLKRNATFWPRAVYNAAKEGDAKTAAGTVTKQSYNVAKFFVKVYGIYALAWLWNHKDDESENKEESLSFWMRAMPHINIGNKTLWAQTALADFTEWVGMGELSGVFWRNQAGYTDKKEMGLEASKIIAKAPLNKLYQALNPFIKAPNTFIYGQTTYPDVFNPHYMKGVKPGSKAALERAIIDILGADAKKFYETAKGDRKLEDTLSAYFAGWWIKPSDPETLTEQIMQLKEWSSLKRESKTTRRGPGQPKKGKEEQWQESEIRLKALRKAANN